MSSEEISGVELTNEVDGGRLKAEDGAPSRGAESTLLVGWRLHMATAG